MSDQPETPTTDLTAPVKSDTDTPDTPTVTTESANHEAARWRVKARDAEQQRDQFAAQVANLQRAQVDTHAAAHGIKPEALWASGAQLADLLDEHGVPDEQAIKTAVDTARTSLGIDAPRKPFGALKSGAAVPHERRNTWSAAFAPPER